MKKKLLCTLLTLAMAVSLIGCGSGSAPETSNEPATDTAEETGDSAAEQSESSEVSSGEVIKFALISPMTGENAATGEQQYNGTKLAVDAINAAGGVNGKMLEFDVYDDQANTNQAVICGEKIASEEGYRFVVASNSSGCSQAAYPALEGANLPLISGVNTADFMTEQGFSLYMRLCVKDSAQTEQMVGRLLDAGYTKPAIFYSTAETDTTNYGIAKELIEAAGLEVVGSAQVEPATEKDFASHITNFKGAGADSVIFCCEYSPAALFIKQAATLGWTGYGRYGTAGCSNPQLIEIAGADVAEGFIAVASVFSGRNVEYEPESDIDGFIDYVSGKSVIMALIIIAGSLWNLLNTLIFQNVRLSIAVSAVSLTIIIAYVCMLGRAQKKYLIIKNR